MFLIKICYKLSFVFVFYLELMVRFELWSGEVKKIVYVVFFIDNFEWCLLIFFINILNWYLYFYLDMVIWVMLVFLWRNCIYLLSWRFMVLVESLFYFMEFVSKFFCIVWVLYLIEFISELWGLYKIVRLRLVCS